MPAWLLFAVLAAILYGLHQVFTKLAANGISDGLGALVVEGSAALTVLLYLLFLGLTHWNQRATPAGVGFSLLTGVCVGAGTVCFFILFQKGGPLSAVPMILAGGAALMALTGIVVFKESLSLPKVLGIVMSLAGLFLLKYSGR
jgi:transporter family protein